MSSIPHIYYEFVQCQEEGIVGSEGPTSYPVAGGRIGPSYSLNGGRSDCAESYSK